jgi:hypothetical protein
MLTLVHRVVPVQQDSITTFNRDCTSSARAALEGHRGLVPDFGLNVSPLLSTYINWYLFTVPRRSPPIISSSP